jgi:hypothetical protein
MTLLVFPLFVICKITQGMPSTAVFLLDVVVENTEARCKNVPLHDRRRTLGGDVVTPKVLNHRTTESRDMHVVGGKWWKCEKCREQCPALYSQWFEIQFACKRRLYV